MNYKKQIQEQMRSAVEQGNWVGGRVGPDVPDEVRNPATGTMDIGAALDLMEKCVENAQRIWESADV